MESFFVVALLGMISMSAMSIYSVVEGMFIGQTLGEGALARIFDYALKGNKTA